MAKKTVAQVQQLLSSHGAIAVMVAYERGEPVAIQFKMMVDGEALGDRMPVNWQAVHHVMCHDLVNVGR